MSAIEYESFLVFLDRIKPLVAPEALAENMEDYFREQVGNSLADLQTLIPWTRGMNFNIYMKDDVEEFCATSVFQGPQGKITELSAYKPYRDCKKLHYKRVSTAKIDCWIEAQRCVQCTFTPPPVNVYDTPYCNYVVLGETACHPPYLTGTEDDCRFLSLPDDQRIFSVGPDYKVYAAPRFPCDYYLLMQWQGIRRKWNDNDPVPVDLQIREAIINRVQKKIGLIERDWIAAREYDAEYAICMRTLRYRYHDEQDPELQRDCSAAIERLLPEASSLYVSYVPPVQFA